MPISTRQAVVLLSGGLDSMVCAALAREAGFGVLALTIDYHQRHRVELDAARTIAAELAERHIVLPLDLSAFGGSALTADIDVPKDGAGEGIPVTYVPARNTVFLSLALAFAEAEGARDLFVGVNALDYSGYPDCRPDFIAAFEALANLGTKAGAEGDPFTIHAPLQHMTKADIAREAARLGLDAGLSHSCYDPIGDGACGAMRRVPPSRQGVRGGWSARSDALRGGPMTYAVKEAFLTLQGEGVQAGSRAVFLRFAGCNLWSGREEDRRKAICQFCDTDFVGTDGAGGGKFADAGMLADHVADLWGEGEEQRLVVVTGGEPMLQLDTALVDALHERGFRIAVESNGTLSATPGIDWLCISPKAGSEVVQRGGDELKLVWPQPGIDPAELEAWDFANFLVQPMDCEERDAALQAAIALVMDRPRWRLTLQAHKIVGLP